MVFNHQTYQREYMRKWRKKNRAKNTTYQQGYFQKYYADNKEKIIKKTRQYYEENKDKQNARKREYKRENKEYFRALQKKYWRDNKHILGPKNKARYEANSKRYNKMHYKNYKRPKYYSDVEFRLKEVLSARIRQALNHNYKSASTEELIGCTIPELRQHLERQFTDGMSWDNHSITGWHIDHIRPCDSFDLTDPVQQKECFHHSNLQPLWYDDNIRKGTSVLG
jgi:predicted ATP-dependent endonuclease of OLD family